MILFQFAKLFIWFLTFMKMNMLVLGLVDLIIYLSTMFLYFLKSTELI